MWIRKLFFSVLLLSCGWLQAQTVWPAVQSNMYPHIPFMKLVRHEQTVLLGEGNQQTGIFYASLADTYSEQVSNELINDALLKSWSLHSLVRLGTSFVLTFVQDTRILDTQLQDTQGRPIPSYTWMIGSDLPNQDYDNYQILNANRLTQAEQKAGVMILGGGGEDELTGGLGADTLVGGLDSDTLTGGLGSDTFVFAKDSGDIAGVTGDVIKDFNFGKTGGTNADTISLYQLFDSTVVSQLGKGARDDASTLSAYLKLEWTKLDSNLQMVCSVDKDGRSNFSKLFTMTDLIGSVGSGTYQANQADMSLLNGTESTNALLQKMLEEGRLVVQ